MNRTCKNIPKLRQLCGDNALSRVVLGTTHWGEVDKDEGKMRQQQLAMTFWQDSESKPLRFDQKESCAWAILDAILCPVIILCAFSRLLITIGTDSWY